jgi:hypothetical protein
MITQSITASEMQLPSSSQVAIPMMIETRQVLLEWPSSMRIGEKEEIALVFEPVETEVSSPTQQIESSNIYSSYNIMAEARFEVAGIRVFPANPTRVSMPAGQTVKFKWQISADQAGSYNGTIWLSLRFLPLDGTQASQVPIYIHDVRIQTASLFGMNETMAYSIGGAGIVLGMALVFGDMIKWIQLWTRKKTTQAR